MENNLDTLLMNIHSNVWFACFFWLSIILIRSSISDIRTRKIPNILTFSTLLLIPSMLLISHGHKGLLYSTSGILMGLAMFVVPYIFGKMGAGDIKLMACVGSVFGPFHTIIATLFVAFAGGIYAVTIILKQRSVAKFPARLAQTANQNSQDNLNIEINQDTIPYAVAITGGVILYLIYLFATNQQSLLITGL